MFDRIQTFPLTTPALRALEINPVRTPQGQTLIMVRDPIGLLEQPIFLMPDPLLFVFIQMADGKTSTGEMAQKTTMMSGQIIPPGLFDRIAEQLDEALLLQSERYATALQGKYKAWVDSPTRPYKIFQAEGMERLKMMKELGEEFRRHRMSADSPPSSLDLPAGSVSAILSPHIDYARGGPAYAWAYEALKQAGTGAKRFIVLGTSHRPSQHRFIATRKAYDTPLGPIPNDTALLDEIAAEYKGSLFEDEYLHADEHTIELQTTYLRHTFPDASISVVPILVTSFEDLLEEGVSPADDPSIPAFITALRTVLARHGDAVCLIGGVDFSHCGPEFGDEELNEPERVKQIEAGDRGALGFVEKMDSKGFFDSFRPDQNARKVCSIGTVYTVMEALQGSVNPRLLSYQQNNSADKACLVSFASVAFLKAGVEAKPKSRIILLR